MGQDRLWKMDTEGGVEQDGDYDGAGSTPQDPGHLHIHTSLPDNTSRDTKPWQTGYEIR